MYQYSTDKFALTYLSLCRLSLPGYFYLIVIGVPPYLHQLSFGQNRPIVKHTIRILPVMVHYNSLLTSTRSTRFFLSILRIAASKDDNRFIG